MSPTRRWHRIASAWLLIAAGAHFTGHWRAYLAVDRFEPARRAAMQAMQDVVLYPPWQVTLWTALGFFSLSFGLLLAAFGASQWILAREADPRTLRRHALRNALLCALATAMAALLHPLPAGLVVLGGAALLFALAAWPRALDQ